MIGCMNHTTLSNDWKRPQTKVKYFVLVFLTKCFMPTPIQSPIINSKFEYNDSILVGNTIQRMHHNNEGENCMEDLVQRGYTHFAVSYTTSLMQYIKYKYKHTMVQKYNVCHMHTAW